MADQSEKAVPGISGSHSGHDRRKNNTDDFWPERRSGKDRRGGSDRRKDSGYPRDPTNGGVMERRDMFRKNGQYAGAKT